MSLSADDLAAGFFRFTDLKAMKIVSSRSDLKDKQDEADFPRPLKPGTKVALFSVAEVNRWLLALAAKRDERDEKIQNAKNPIAETKPAPRRRAGEPSRRVT